MDADERPLPDDHLPAVSVVIVTLSRPDCLEQCLRQLSEQVPPPRETVVVDASPDLESLAIVQGFPGIRYVRHANGAGHMTTSRNIGLALTTAPVVAFIDDDAYVHPGWLANVASSFRPGVGAVGGRVLQGLPGEADHAPAVIGRLTERGALLGHFGTDPGHEIDVDHVQGCNMAFSRSVLERLGGLRDDFPGTAVREETDVCLRVGRLGERVVFNPAAVVTHVGAAQARGQRFDLRYDYFAQRNHCQLLLRNYGPRHPIVRGFLADSWRATVDALVARLRQRQIRSGLARLGVVLAGTMTGIVAGLRLLARDGLDPVRRTQDGVTLTATLLAGRACGEA